jgi:thiaminase
MLTEHAAGALRVERTLHEGFFREFGLSAEAVSATPLAPTTLAYTHYLLAVASGRSSREARHCFAALRHSDIRAWVFLAQTQGMPICLHTEEQNEVLAREA